MRWGKRRMSLEGQGLVASDWRNARTAGEKQWSAKGGLDILPCTDALVILHPCLCIVEGDIISGTIVSPGGRQDVRMAQVYLIYHGRSDGSPSRRRCEPRVAMQVGDAPQDIPRGEGRSHEYDDTLHLLWPQHP